MPDTEPSALARRMTRVMSAFRSKLPPYPLEAPAGVFYLPGRLRGRPYTQPFVWFATRGCRQYERTGGCTMCDFGCGSYTDDEVIAGVKDVLAHLGATPLVHLCAVGSFFDDAEVSPGLRAALLEAVGGRDVEVVGVESRPEHVTAEEILRTVRSLGGSDRLRQVAIGMGLEAFDPLVAEVAVNKGYSRAVLGRALERLKQAQDDTGGVELAAEVHVLLKPPFLTEGEAVEDALAATLWALENGARRVILMAGAVKPRTLVGWLAHHGAEDGLGYSPPSLWSAIEVLKRLPEEYDGKVFVHGFVSSTPIETPAHTCPSCEHMVEGALYDYDMLGRRDALGPVDALECDCRDRWRESLREELPPLPERLDAALTALEGRFVEE